MAVSENKTSGDIAQIATAASAAIAVLVSLAVTGVLARAQRNHGYLLFSGLGLILLGSLGWFVATILPENLPMWRQRRNTARFAFWLRVVAGLLFLVGLICAILAVVRTERDAQRPAVAASFDAAKSVLTAKVSADGLGTNQRMAVGVEGLKQRGNTPTVDAAEPNKPLFFALLGPDADGKVKYEFSVYVPPRFRIVGVEAWTADTKPACFDRPQGHQAQEAGCAVLRLKERQASTSGAAE